jgi:hypothetical protein
MEVGVDREGDGGRGASPPPSRARDRTSEDKKKRTAKGRGSSAQERKMEGHYTHEHHAKRRERTEICSTTGQNPSSEADGR